MNAQPLTPPTEEPSVAGVRVRPVLPMLLFVLLVGSALLALWAQQSPVAPEPISRFAPWAFLAFAIGFAAYRLALVAAKRYSAFKAFAQIIVAALFFMLLLLPQVSPPLEQPAVAPEDLLRDRDPRVRALAAEVLGYREAQRVADLPAANPAHAKALVELLGDSNEAVRQAARKALTQLNGGRELEPAVWKERFP
jgi:hypothetical protein